MPFLTHFHPMTSTPFLRYQRLTSLSLALLICMSSVFGQTEDSNDSSNGAQMMEELVRLTMVPLADTPINFDGSFAYELTQSDQTTVGELRWGNSGKTIMWTDEFDKKGLYTLQLDPSKPLATLTMMNEEGHFLTSEMMTRANLWSENGTPPPFTKELKIDSRAEADTLLGYTCMKYRGKSGKEKVAIWIATESVNLSKENAYSLRTAWGHWLNSRVTSKVLRGLILRDGLPLKVEWGESQEDGRLPNVMTILTLNASAAYTLNAPQIWMHVPGRDINEVARELRDEKGAKDTKD